MGAMSSKAPTLAWVLTALACFLAGALVGEGWSQAAPPPAFPTVEVAVTVAVAFEPTATPGPASSPAPVPTVDPAALAPWPPPSPGSAPTPAPVLTPWMPLDRLPTPASDPTAGAPQSGGTGNVR